jgi:hypothetical protein
MRASEGWRWLYCELSPNVARNASSWAFTFYCASLPLRCSFRLCGSAATVQQLKRRVTEDAMTRLIGQCNFSIPALFRRSECDSDHFDMGIQGPDVHRASQLPPPSSLGTLGRVLCDMPWRTLAQPLPRHLTCAIRRQQCTTVHGIREDKRLGIQA